MQLRTQRLSRGPARPGAHAGTKDPRGARRPGDRGHLHQGRDPGDVPQSHLFRERRARHRGGGAALRFGRGARDLTYAQAALLAAMPKAPSHYDPRRHPKEARERRDLVLSLMAEQKRITPAEKDEAVKSDPLGAVPKPRAEKPDAPFAAYFVEEVRRELEDRLRRRLLRAQAARAHHARFHGPEGGGGRSSERQLRSIEGGALGAFSGPRYAANLQVADDGETPYRARRGGGAGRDHRRRAGLGRRPRLPALALRSREVGAAPGGQRVQALRLRHRRGLGRMLNQKVLDQPLEVSLGGRRSRSRRTSTAPSTARSRCATRW